MLNRLKSLSFSLGKPAGFLVLVAVATTAFFVGGELLDESGAPTSFHDMRVLPPDDLMILIDGGDPQVGELARRLGSTQEAYRHVRDRIAFEPSRPAGGPAETIAAGRASCLGKAALLASLYRALGMEHGEVRVVTGQVAYGDELTEHAWLELEHDGVCLQQDATPLLGTFAFDEFRGRAYTQRFVWRELFCFNDEGFAVVSQLNRFGGGHPH